MLKFSEQLNKALQIAIAAHFLQEYDGKPYILHPIRVAMRLEGEEEQIVAILHDVVEDSDLELSDLAPLFDESIVEALDAITRRKYEIYKEYIERVSKNPIAREVKLADLQENLSRIPEMLDVEKTASLSIRYLDAYKRLKTIESEDIEHKE